MGHFLSNIWSKTSILGPKGGFSSFKWRGFGGLGCTDSPYSISKCTLNQGILVFFEGKGGKFALVVRKIDKVSEKSL